MDFKNVPKKYRPIPFWSWNEKLNTEETKRQVREMDSVGIGGFFMHARGGLQTKYMGEEWFENVEAAVEAAEELGMRPWAYDENGWPSGFGNGVVNGLGVEYQQKYLRMEDEPEHADTAICKCGEHYFYYEVNPYYVDTLDKKVIAKFIESTYQPYYEKYGRRVEGFFTDEPQVSRSGIPWSFVFEEEYARRYGENILESLEQLFLPVGEFKKTRVKFWKMVTALFSEAYMKQIYDWCDERGMKLTGHLVLENNPECQLYSNGACMPHYEYFHIPGMDWLGRNINSHLVPLQVSSVAEQLGKEAVISETYAMCGHNVSFAELKGIYEWQMVRGINLLCQHLEGYSIRGIRKRDYPPAMYLQQPWWAEYDKFNDAMSREGMILKEGRHQVDVLLLHPQTTAWVLYDAGPKEGMRDLDRNLVRAIHNLERKHIEFHMGDETLMERHGKVENGKLVIGRQSYSVVVDPGCQALFENTEKLLEEFKQAGGKVVTVDDVLFNDVIDNPAITYTKRSYDDFNVHFFVNTSGNREVGTVAVKGKKLDIYTGELEAFSGVHEFEPWGSLMVVEPKAAQAENGAEAAEAQECKCACEAGKEAAAHDKTIEEAAEIQPANLIQPAGKFHITESTPNSLTLDKCDYYFDGVLQEANGYVLNICERANELGRAVKLHQDYHVEAAYIPENLYLVCETPEKFHISVNGVEIKQQVEGYFVDKSFQKLDIAKYMQIGENTISFDCDFKQPDELYENLKKAKIFESEKNKLAYDMEIEAVYLVGDFCLKTEGEWTNLENKAVRYHGKFVIDAPKREVEIKNLEQQGYPFFCGSMTLEGELDIQGENPILDIDWKGINALRVEINGIEKVLLTDNRLSLAEFGVEGLTRVKFTFFNNLRNLLGPHHRAEGEVFAVGPGSFFKEVCVWTGKKAAPWHDDYCFVEMGL